jgi:hypothetical protein
MAAVVDVEVIEDPAAAAAALEPVRSRLLAELAGDSRTRHRARGLKRPPTRRGWPASSNQQGSEKTSTGSFCE